MTHCLRPSRPGRSRCLPKCGPELVPFTGCGFGIAEEAFHDVAHSIEIGIVWYRFADIAFGRDDAQCAFICDLSSNFAASVSFVGDDGERRLAPVPKGVHHLAVMNIAARYGEQQGTTMRIYSGVDFARAATP
jgi:hypothetical protein